MSLDHDLENLPRLSDEGHGADEAMATRDADGPEFELLKQRISTKIDKLKELESAMEDRDVEELLIYRTICAAIILLDDEEDVGMVTDMLRLARNSMTRAQELIVVHVEATEVSHG